MLVFIGDDYRSASGGPSHPYGEDSVLALKAIEATERNQQATDRADVQLYPAFSRVALARTSNVVDAASQGAHSTVASGRGAARKNEHWPLSWFRRDSVDMGWRRSDI
jgi:hypothetical protein